MLPVPYLVAAMALALGPAVVGCGDDAADVGAADTATDATARTDIVGPGYCIGAGPAEANGYCLSDQGCAMVAGGGGGTGGRPGRCVGSYWAAVCTTPGASPAPAGCTSDAACDPGLRCASARTFGRCALSCQGPGDCADTTRPLCVEGRCEACDPEDASTCDAGQVCERPEPFQGCATTCANFIGACMDGSFRSCAAPIE